MIEGAAMLPVTVGVGYIYVALAGGVTLPIPMALVVTGSIGLLTGWYAVFQRSELCRRNACLLGIGVLSGLITVVGLLAISMAPLLAGRLAGTASPDARDLVAFLCVVYGAPAIVAIVEGPRIRRGISRA